MTPEMTACSMPSRSNSSSGTTQVPGSQVKLDRTCTRTPWLRANSTDRSASTSPARGGHLQHLFVRHAAQARARRARRAGRR